MEGAKDKLKVSIIIPNYNNGRYIEECLNSVLNQTLKDIEIIVIDDCSTDDSMEILKSFQTKYPEKIKVIRNQENSGAGLSRNNGLDIATGEFIKFLDADDTMDADVLESMYNAAKEHNVKIVTGQLRVLGSKTEYIVDRTGETDRRINISKQREELVFGSAGIGDQLFARELFDDIRFPKLKWEDFATIPAIKVLANDIYDMNKVVYNYRVHDTSTTSTDICKKTPRIFDIVYCLRNLRQIIPEGYKEELDAMEVIHYGVRMREIASWQDCSEEYKKILINSLHRIMELEVPDYKKNKYVGQPEQQIIKLSSYLDKNMTSISDEELYEVLAEFSNNSPTISELMNRLQADKRVEQEHRNSEDGELIESVISVAKDVVVSEQYSEDDKKRKVTLLYQALSRVIPNLEEKISKIGNVKKKFGSKGDDTRYSDLSKKVQSYLEEGYITSDSVEEILENVQQILTSEEFLKYSMERTTRAVLQDGTITPEDIRGSEQHENDNMMLSGKGTKGEGVEVDD